MFYVNQYIHYPGSSYALEETSLTNIELIDQIEFGIPYPDELILPRCDDNHFISKDLTNFEAIDHLIMSPLLDHDVLTTCH